MEGYSQRSRLCKQGRIPEDHPTLQVRWWKGLEGTSIYNRNVCRQILAQRVLLDINLAMMPTWPFHSNIGFMNIIASIIILTVLESGAPLSSFLEEVLYKSLNEWMNNLHVFFSEDLSLEIRICTSQDWGHWINLTVHINNRAIILNYIK